MTRTLADWPAHRIVEAVRLGAPTAREFVEACLRRIDERNPAIHAVIARCDARARAEADAIDRAVANGEAVGPLAGVPTTIKDMHATAGLRTTFGLPWYHRNLPDRDSAAVGRLRGAGAIVLGKTNVPFAGYDWQTRHPTCGVTTHPARPDRTCGGSSGGAAAALAAGFCALELGSDLAGSIRVPAHFCGVHGLKTSDGVVALDGHGPPEARVEHMCVVGPMARSVEDLRIALDVLAEPGLAPGRAEPVGRIAITDRLCGITADAATRAALGALEAAMRAAGGIDVERATPPAWDTLEPLEIWAGVDGYEFRRSWPRPFQSRIGRMWFRCGIVAAGIGPGVLSRALARSMAGDAERHARQLARRARFADATDAWLRGFDALIAPCAATPAFTHRRLPRAIDVDDSKVAYSLAQSAFCCPVNVAGACASTAPIGRTEDGLPIGAQWIGARGHDRAILDVVDRCLAVSRGSSPGSGRSPRRSRAPSV